MNTSRRKFIKRGIWGAVTAGLSDSYIFERYLIDVHEEPVNRHPAGDSSFKVVQISDLHFRSLHWGLKTAVSHINRLQPDLVLFTGDAVDDWARLEKFASFLNLLDRDIPKFAVPGNWEYWGGVSFPRLRELYTTSNCRLLINETARIRLPSRNGRPDRTFAITGVDDFIAGEADYVLATQGEWAPADFHIVMSHCPQYRDTLVGIDGDGPKIDLVLSGHTHGGQANLLGFTPFLPNGSGRYLKGWYREAEPPLYVSKGIGTTMLPFRFMARAEIPVFVIGL